MKNFLKFICKTTGIPKYFLTNLARELKMTFIRIYGLMPNIKGTIKKTMMQTEPSVIFGCGETNYPGWFHIDCIFEKNIDLVFDLRRKLPFFDDSISRCYSEHFVEHLFPEEAKKHFIDVNRVLKPGGVYRVVVPDCRKFMQKYVEGDKNFFIAAHPWEKYPIDVIYQIMNWSGQHRSIYDFETLERLGIEAGFERVVLSSVNASLEPLFHIDRSDYHRVLESVYVEMVKGTKCRNF